MINGFTKETRDILTTTEIYAMEIIANGLKTKQGESMAVTSTQIVEGIFRANKIKLDPARLRKIIHIIRLEGTVKNLIATHKGYYIEKDLERLKEYVHGLRQRSYSINQIANSYNIDNPNQLELFEKQESQTKVGNVYSST